MLTLIIFIFVIGYALITLEHTIKIDKAVPALIMMSLIWSVVALLNIPVFHIGTEGLMKSNLNQVVGRHLWKTAEILFFLVGAMTIVEIIEYFSGFETIKKFIKTNSKRKLLWIISILAFLLSAVIDNLTATIVLIVILRKLIASKNDRIWFSGLIIIAANSGGAWSPIGDVTTTMLWVSGKVTVFSLIKNIILPSLISMVIPVFIASRLKVFRGTFNSQIKEELKKDNYQEKLSAYGPRMLYMGIGLIIFVPIFKMVTHLPPYMGMMLSLAIFAIFAEIFSKRAFSLSKLNAGYKNPVHESLARIEFPSILFFLGILMAVAALESVGLVFQMGNYIESNVGTNLFIVFLGVISAVLDNVPLVAASMGMFPAMPIDSAAWHFIAYAAGTGGSLLIIGSAAGVVAMGMEKINFFWYLKKITPLALIGYLSGVIIIYLTLL